MSIFRNLSTHQARYFNLFTINDDSMSQIFGIIRLVCANNLEEHRNRCNKKTEY